MQSGKNRQRQGTKTCRTGFSLVELIIALLVIAAISLAVFASGAVVVAKARTSRMDSDFHNFETAISTFMFEDRSLATMDSGCSWSDFRGAALSLNKYLPDGYEALVDEPVPADGPIMSSNENQVIFRTAKEDPYGNSYYLLFDTTDRNSGKTEYYITALSAGGNGKADVCGPLDKDDAFLLGQYSNGDVYVKSYFMDEDSADGAENTLTPGESSLSSLSGLNTPKNYGTGLSATGDPHVHRYVTTENTAATCTSAGLFIQTCTGCGNTKRSTPAALGHDFGEYVVTKQATCTAAGVRTSTCSRCRQTKTLSIEAKGHSFSGWTETKTGTCTEPGQEQRECTACHTSETRDTGTTDNHSWGEPVITAATCVTDGSKVYTCVRCGATKTEPIPATGTHVFSDTPDNVVPATCTTNGKKIYTCQTCPQTKEEVIMATGAHTYSATPTRVVAASCTEAGRNIYACTVCGDEREDVILPTGHNFPADWTTDVSATCTTDGLQIKRCQNAGCSETLTQVLSKLGHSYPAEWTVVTQSTCTDDGLQEKRCQHAGCTETQTSVISKTGHAYASEWTITSDATCITDGEKIRPCTNAGCTDAITQVIPRTGHSYPEGWTVQTEATCTTDGLQVKHCQNNGCAETVSSVIPKTGHSYSEWTRAVEPTCYTDGEWRRVCATCGDIETLPISMTGSHVYGAYKETISATCTEEGLQTATCTTPGCGHQITAPIPALGHSVGEWVVVTQPTRTSVGIKKKECVTCGTIIETAEIPLVLMTNLYVTNPPTKTDYVVGEDFIDDGMVITAAFDDGSTDIIPTGDYTITDGTSMQTTSSAVTISYTENGMTLSCTQAVSVTWPVSSLHVTTNPDRMEYIIGEDFDLTGMVAMAEYADGTMRDVTDKVIIQEGTNLAEGQAAVNITYMERGVTVSRALPITVRNGLTALTITTPPDKTTYELGDDIDTTGMVVTASYANGTSRIVQDGYVLDTDYIESEERTSITITYTDLGDTRTASLPITVNPLTQLVNYTMLYDYGDECTSITGGWYGESGKTSQGYRYYAMTKNSTYINGSYSESNAPSSNIKTRNSIDYTGYVGHLLRFDYRSSVSGNNTWNRVSAGGPSDTPIIFPLNDKGIASSQSTFSGYRKMNYTLPLKETAGQVGVSLWHGYAMGKTTANLNLYSFALYKEDSWAQMCKLAGVETPSTIAELLADSSKVATILSNRGAVEYMTKRCTGSFMAAALEGNSFDFSGNTFLDQLGTSPYKDAIYANEHWAKFLNKLP